MHKGSHTAIGGGERYWEDKNMNKDICVRCGEGVVNIRVGAIIIKDNRLLTCSHEQSAHIGYRYESSKARGDGFFDVASRVECTDQM